MCYLIALRGKEDESVIDEQTRSRLSFWARLATIVDPKELAQSERDDLAQQLAVELRHATGWRSLDDAPKAFRESEKYHNKPIETVFAGIAPGLLKDACATAVDLRQFVVSGAVGGHGFEAMRRFRLVEDDERRIHRTSDFHGFKELLEADLSALLERLEGEINPLDLCPECQKRIFVRTARQKYCSPNCSYRAVERARRPTRAAYLRKWRRDRKKRGVKGK